MKKKYLVFFMVILLGLNILGCSSRMSDTLTDEDKQQTSEYEPFILKQTILDREYDITYDAVPQKAVTLSQFMTEMLLALGLGDNMAGTAFMDNEIYPEFEEEYNKIPVIAEQYPSKEILFSSEPDFISGWASAFDEKRVASVDEMMGNGIKPYIALSIGKDGNFETLYQDFENLGRIFNVSEKAEEVNDKIKSQLNGVQEKIKDVSENEKPSVLFYDSGETEPFVVAGGGISGDIVRQAGGINIFEDIKKGYATVSFEEIVARNPQIIVIVDYGDTDYDTKLNFIKTHPALKEIKAVKDDKFVKIRLADLSPGIRNSQAVEDLSSAFYPDLFK